MINEKLGKCVWRRWIVVPVPLLLVLLLACGTSAAPDPVVVEKEVIKEVQVEVPVDREVIVVKEVIKEVPVEVVVVKEVERIVVATAAAETPPVEVRPSGVLHVGRKELGPFMGHPGLATNPQILINEAAPITESLGQHNTTDGAVVPMLAESWTISPDFKVWTFNIRKGVQFHKGWGELTAEDVIWSMEQVAASTKHPRAGTVNELWRNPEGSLTAPDPYTVVLDTGRPFADVTMLELIASPRSTSAWITSKRQSEEIGAEEANRDTAATGSWELLESKTGEFWRLKAVEDHWRKTPYFAEMFLWEIPEESTRVAGFQTGKLDTFVMALDSLPLVEQVEGARFMQVPNSGQAGLNFYGQMYLGIGTPEQAASYDPTLPWISADPDVNSIEWDNARKVREALSISIDRQLLVDTLLRGFGRPLVQRDWAGVEHRLPTDMKWDYDPERARALLAEAGYPKGISITLTPSIRGAPAEVEVCEAIAGMWKGIGVDVDLQRIPYTTLRPQIVGRTYNGATCHSVGIRLAPSIGLNTYMMKSVFNYGTMHPVLEDLAPKALEAVDPRERERYELEAARFCFDNVFCATGLYVFDSIWAVGPKVEPWLNYVRRGDLRQINGMEWARPRQ